MPVKRRALVVAELVYAFLSVAAAVALIFSLGPVSHATNQSSERILGAALLAMGLGALAVARDPAGNRVMLRVEIVFTAVSTLALVWKVVVDEDAGPSTWVLLAGLVVGAAVLAWLSPAAAAADEHADPAGDPATDLADGRRP